MKEKESNKIFENDLINLSQILKLLLKSKILVIIVVSIFALAGIFYGNSQKSTYNAQADIFFGTFGGNNIANAKIIDTYLDGIDWDFFANPGGGFFLRIGSSSHVSAEQAELKLEEALDFLLEYTNNLIEEKIEKSKYMKESEDVRVNSTQQAIDLINQEINKKVKSDGYSNELLQLKATLINLEIDSKNSTYNIPEYKFSKIINEIKSYKSPNRPTYFYFILGAIIGFLVSVFLVVTRFLEE